MNGEGFLGTIQLVVPAAFKGAKVQYLPGDEGDGDTRFAVLTAKTAHKEPLFFVGDGQGRLVGLFSLERSAEEDIDQLEKEIKKFSKAGADTTVAMQELARADGGARPNGIRPTNRPPSRAASVPPDWSPGPPSIYASQQPPSVGAN